MLRKSAIKNLTNVLKMKKLLTLALLSAFLTFNEAKAGEIDDPVVVKPDNGDCFVWIFQSPKGNERAMKFMRAIQSHLEDDYIPVANVSTAYDYSRKANEAWINLYKEDC